VNISGLRSSGVFHFHTRHNDVHLSTTFSQESFRASEDHVHVAAATPEKNGKHASILLDSIFLPCCAGLIV
jgi:hypothetical protein